MSIIKTNNAEGGTNGTAVTTANSGGTSGTAWSLTSYPSGSLTYDVAASAHGSLGYTFAPASGQQCIVRWTGFNDTTGVVRFYHTDSANPSSTESIFAAYTSTGVACIVIGINATGHYVVQNAAVTTVYTSTASRAAGDRIELSWTIGTTTSNGSWNFAMYRGDSASATETTSSTTTNLGTTNWDRIQIGKNSTSTWVGVTSKDDIAAASGTTTFFGPASSNIPPTANAGPDQSNIEPWYTVTLDGTGSSDPDAGDTITYAWSQTAGTTVTLSDPTAAQPTFVAPGTIAGTTLTFSLTVTDNHGASSSPDTVSVVVLTVTERAVVGGVEVPVHLQTLNNGTLG